MDKTALFQRRSLGRGILGRVRYGSRSGPVWNRLQWWDDFDWRRYTERSYRADLASLEDRHSTRLRTVGHHVTDHRIVLGSTAKPMHPSHRLIYETALRLRPTRIFEIGCGGGDHLANLRCLLPDAVLGGADISEEQIAFAWERNGSVLADPAALLEVRDMTRPESVAQLEGWADLVFCNSVVMHIQRGDRHRTLLRNMWRISSRYVLLVENWSRHDFVRDILALFPGVTPQRIAVQGAVGLLLDKLDIVCGVPIQHDRELRQPDKADVN